MSAGGFVDAAILRSVTGLLGAPRLAELLGVFEARIAWLGEALAALPDGHAAILASLHQSRGSAVSLGFTGLDRALAEIQQRLGPEMARGDLDDLGEAMRRAWQACLAEAALHSPELRHHRPFGSNR